MLPPLHLSKSRLQLSGNPVFFSTLCTRFGETAAISSYISWVKSLTWLNPFVFYLSILEMNEDLCLALMFDSMVLM